MKPQQIKQLRTRLGLTQKQFAQNLCKAGVDASERSIQEWEGGRRCPNGRAMAGLMMMEFRLNMAEVEND